MPFECISACYVFVLRRGKQPLRLPHGGHPVPERKFFSLWRVVFYSHLCFVWGFCIPFCFVFKYGGAISPAHQIMANIQTHTDLEFITYFQTGIASVPANGILYFLNNVLTMPNSTWWMPLFQTLPGEFWTAYLGFYPHTHN